MNKRNALFFLVFLVSLFGSMAASHAQLLGFRYYRAQNGLLQSQVMTILQDNDGYLWFGTINGVFKFDGLHFVNTNRSNGLAANYINTGFKDRQGNLWFGHNNGSISKFDWQTKKYKNYFLQGRSNKSTLFITAIFEDKQDQIWFATEGKGVYCLQKDSLLHYTKQNGLTDNDVFSICQPANGQLWFGTFEGVAAFDPVRKKFTKLNKQIAFKKSIINSLLSDHQRNIWVGTADRGLVKISKDLKHIRIFNKKEGLKGLNIWRIYEDQQNHIWVSIVLKGVAELRTSSEGKAYFNSISIENGLGFNDVNAIIQDREGNYWFGTNGKSVSQLRDTRFKRFTTQQGLLDNSVWSVLVSDNKTLWVGSNIGVTRIKFKHGAILSSSKQLTEKIGTKQNSIVQIFQDSRGDMWAVSYTNGLYHQKEGSHIWRKFRSKKGPNNIDISNVGEDKYGHLWFGTYNSGIWKFDRKQRKFEHFSHKSGKISSNTIKVIYRDRQKNLWFGTVNGGAIKYDYKTFTIYKDSAQSVMSISQGAGKDIWLVTDSDQLFRLREGRIKNFSVGYGLEGQTLYSVICDSQSVWVGTSVGVARMIYGSKQFVFYGKPQGYPVAETNENAVFKDKQGRLWFGTVEGVVEYEAQKVRVNTVEPFTHLTGLKIYHQPQPFPENGRFSYKNNYLTFNFIGISLTVPERVRYRYLLQGLDKDWSPPTKINSVTYPNLPFGKYTFKVIASNNDGIWNKSPVSYQFEILPPFWRTWWFELLVTIAILGLIYFIIHLRTNRIERARKRLENKVRQRTIELLNEKEQLEKTLQALNESESKFRSYTDVSTTAFYIHQDNRFKYVNRAAEEISGFSKEELYNMNIWDMVHPDFAELLRTRALARISGNDVPERYEFKFIKKNGKECWVDFSGRPIQFEGKPAILASVLDISDRKKAEEELLAEKERLDVTLRSINEGVITTDTQGKILLANRMAEKLLGQNQKHLKGQTLSDKLYLEQEQTGKKFPDPVEMIVDAGGYLNLDETAILKTPQGNRFVVEYSASALHDKSSNLVGVVFVFRDITDKRKLEDEVIKSQKLESVGVLAGGIAHDFNNILTAIIGNLSLVKMKLNPEDKIYTRIENAENASARAQELTQQLLTFSKGGAPIRRETSINEIIRDSVAFILSGSNVRCHLDIAEHLPLVNVDAGQISQVIQNLVLNADQAMPEGGNILVRVQKEKIEKAKVPALKPGNYLCIEVADEGIGIPPEYLPKIFDPFFSTKKTGSGLGLATCYSIIKKHEGQLLVRSKVGKGTTFTIYLPALKKEAQTTTENKEDRQPSRGQGRLLIMDDETYILETAADMLNYMGFEVGFSKNGDEAIASYKQALENNKPFDAVIMDLTIPGGMGGKSAIKKLLEIDSEIKAIVSSGYSNDPVMSNYQEYGFSGRLQKPFRLEELGNVLRDLKLL